MRVLLFVVLLMCLVGLDACAATSPNTQTHVAVPSSSGDGGPEERSATLLVNGLACPFCVHNIEKKLLEVPGVRTVNVELDTGRVVLTLSPSDAPSEQELRDAITKGGFTVASVEMP